MGTICMLGALGKLRNAGLVTCCMASNLLILISGSLSPSKPSALSTIALEVQASGLGFRV